ncbi:MAG: hypothetical protein ACWGNV_12980, partial [Bacteroidales bacterium]
LRAIPRRWLKDGEVIRIKRQPTPYGQIGLEVGSQVREGFIEMSLVPPPVPVPGGIKIRLRHPEGRSIEGVELDGKPWKQFSDEYIFIPGTSRNPMTIKVQF